MLPFATEPSLHESTQSPNIESITKRKTTRAALMLFLALTVVSILRTTTSNPQKGSSSTSLKTNYLMSKSTTSADGTFPVVSQAKHSKHYIPNIASDRTAIETDPDQRTICAQKSVYLAYGITTQVMIPLNTGSVRISLCNSTMDTKVEILRGNVVVGSCDDGSSGLAGCSACGPTRNNELWDLMNFLPNQQYSIRVSSYGAPGTARITVVCGPKPVTTTTTTQPGSCPTPRVRKDWMHLTQQERDLYITGFKKLRENGKLGILTRTHNSALTYTRVHMHNMFLYWHRYFIWELEEQIRALGGNYSCFTLPYWDWTRNAGNEYNNPMFNQGLGGNGVPSSGNCVQNGGFQQGQYVDSYGNCLRRVFEPRATPFESAQALVTQMINMNSYGTFRMYLEVNHHNRAHGFLGGVANTGASPDEPFFYLLHTMVDMSWALWQDCHNYENTPLGLQNTQICGNIQLDAPMVYDPLLRNAPWSRVSKTTITPREVHNIQGGGFLNYKYETSILARSNVAFGRCNFTTNATAWFGQVPPYPRDEAEFIARDLDLHSGLMSRALEGDERAALAVGVDATFGQNVSHQEKRVIISDYACKKLSKLEYANGGPAPCKFDPATVEHCGMGPRDLNISLAELLAKRGVAGTPCLMDVRKAMFPMCKLLGTLRDLCNGMYDAVLECNYQKVHQKAHDIEKYENEHEKKKKKNERKMRKKNKSGKHGKKKRKNKGHGKKKSKKSSKGDDEEDEQEDLEQK